LFLRENRAVVHDISVDIKSAKIRGLQQTA